MQPSTPSTRASITSGSLLEKIETAKVHSARISPHNSNEPSWLPHTAVIL